MGRGGGRGVLARAKRCAATASTAFDLSQTFAPNGGSEFYSYLRTKLRKSTAPEGCCKDLPKKAREIMLISYLRIMIVLE